MRVVFDTNILISALLLSVGQPAAIYRAWLAGRFTLVTSRGQLEELRATLRKPRLAQRIRRHDAGHMFNQLRKLAVLAGRLPRVRRSSDPDDDLCWQSRRPETPITLLPATRTACWCSDLIGARELCLHVNLRDFSNRKDLQPKFAE
jgi:hypothetical protein